MKICKFKPASLKPLKICFFLHVQKFPTECVDVSIFIALLYLTLLVEGWVSRRGEIILATCF